MSVINKERVRTLWGYYTKAVGQQYVDGVGRTPRRAWLGFCAVDALILGLCLGVGYVTFYPGEMEEYLKYSAWWAPLYDGFLICSYMLIYLLLTLPARVAITMRRLHDIGRSGRWALGYYAWLVVVPVSLRIVAAQLSARTLFNWLDVLSLLVVLMLTGLLFVWMLRPGQEQPNRWGEPPRDAAR